MKERKIISDYLNVPMLSKGSLKHNDGGKVSLARVRGSMVEARKTRPAIKGLKDKKGLFQEHISPLEAR